MNLLFGLAAVVSLAVVLALCAVVVRAVGWIRLFEALLIVGMVIGALSIVATVLDQPGLGVIGDTQPFVDRELAQPVDLKDVGSAMIDGRPVVGVVEVGEPVTARFTFVDPDDTDVRVIWVLWQVAGSLLWLAGLGLVLSIVRSAKHGDPFVRANVRRLWWLAALLAIGGTVYSMLSGFAAVLMVQRSAAADLTPIQFTVDFLWILLGIAIAALATVWRVGVGLREDVDGMV